MQKEDKPFHENWLAASALLSLALASCCYVLGFGIAWFRASSNVQKALDNTGDATAGPSFADGAKLSKQDVGRALDNLSIPSDA